MLFLHEWVLQLVVPAYFPRHEQQTGMFGGGNLQLIYH